MTELQTRRFLPLASVLIVFAVVIGAYFAVKGLPIDMLGEIRSGESRWGSLLLISVLQAAFLLIITEIWRTVVLDLTGKRLKLSAAYIQIAVVSVAKYIPGKVWGIVARTGDMARQRIPLATSLLGSLTEQLLMLAGAVIVTIMTSLVVFPSYAIWILAGGGVLIATLVAASTRIPALAAWIARKRNTVTIVEAVHSYSRARMAFLAMAYAVPWLLGGAIFSVIYFSLFDVAVTVDRVAALILGNTVGVAVGFFALFAPGGIGVREAVSTIVLASFIPVREALLAAVAYRAWTVLIDGLNAILLLAAETRLARKQ